MSLSCAPIIYSIDGSNCGFAPAGGFTLAWAINADQVTGTITKDSSGKVSGTMSSYITGSAKQYKPVVSGQVSETNEGDVQGQTITQVINIPMSYSLLNQARKNELQKHCYNRTYWFVRKNNKTFFYGFEGNGFLAEAGGLVIDSLTQDSEIPNVNLTVTARNPGLAAEVDETSWQAWIAGAGTSAL